MSILTFCTFPSPSIYIYIHRGWSCIPRVDMATSPTYSPSFRSEVGSDTLPNDVRDHFEAFKGGEQGKSTRTTLTVSPFVISMTADEYGRLVSAMIVFACQYGRKQRKKRQEESIYESVCICGLLNVSCFYLFVFFSSNLMVARKWVQKVELCLQSWWHASIENTKESYIYIYMTDFTSTNENTRR